MTLHNRKKARQYKTRTRQDKIQLPSDVNTYQAMSRQDRNETRLHVRGQDYTIQDKPSHGRGQYKASTHKTKQDTDTHKDNDKGNVWSLKSTKSVSVTIFTL